MNTFLAKLTECVWEAVWCVFAAESICSLNTDLCTQIGWRYDTWAVPKPTRVQPIKLRIATQTTSVWKKLPERVNVPWGTSVKDDGVVDAVVFPSPPRYRGPEDITGCHLSRGECHVINIPPIPASCSIQGIVGL